jgi:hypothetical protein
MLSTRGRIFCFHYKAKIRAETLLDGLLNDVEDSVNQSMIDISMVCSTSHGLLKERN